MLNRNRFSGTTVLTIGLLAWGGAARGATYYVATTGSDSNAGTSAAPLKTVNAGIAKAAAGDTVLVANGTYLGCSGGTAGSGNMVEINKAGTSAGRITIMAQNRGGAVLDGQNICHTIVDFGTSAAYINVQNFVIQNAYWSGVTINAGSQHDILIKNNEVRNIGNRYNNNNYAITGIYVGIGNSNVTIDGNLIHDNGPTSTGSGDPAHDHQIYLHGSNINVINNVLYNGYNGPYVNLGGSGYTYSGTIANNTFYGYSISSYYIDGTIWSNGNAGDNGIVPIIKNNIFYNVRTVAINGATLVSAGCAVQNNIVFNPPGSTSAGAAKLIAATPTGCTASYTGNKVNVDPLLTSPPSDMHLKAGSPAISAALSVPLVTADFSGTSRPSIPDIGAYQYGTGGTTTPPAVALVISGVTASAVTSTGATVAWTTSVSGDGQVVYGPTTAYGATTAVNSTLSTSHSFTLSGLTASTLYHYAVKSHDSAGNLVTSADATFTTSAAAATVPAGCASSAGTWQNLSVTQQSGSFTAQFDVTPGAAAIDGASGVSNGAATAWSSLAAAVRFNNTGMIDARNGAAYAAAAAIPYVSGMTYHVRLVVNIAAHNYSAYVKQGSNAEQLVGSNYAFRTEQASVTSLNNVGVFTDAGTVTTCSASAAAVVATTISGISVSAIGPTAATVGWTTNNPADSQVQYGATTSYGNTTTLNSAQVTSHSVSLGGLASGTVYHYRVMSRDAVGTLVTSADATFTTTSLAPTISAVAATGVTATGATINWTTNVPGDSQVIYGPAPANVTVVSVNSVYTLSSTLISTLTTSHSVALTGLTASTMYHYAVKSSGTTSPDATFTTPASTAGGGGTNVNANLNTNGSTSGGTPVGGTACMTSAGTWQNVSVNSLTGTFTAEFDGTASAVTTDGVGGLSNGAATAFTSLGVAVRFNNTGKIDARNGGAYAAATSIPYAANTAYHFRLVINLTAHTYSAYVKQGSGAEVLIGSNFAFRTEQNKVTALNNLAGFADAGSVKVCNGTTHL